MTAVELSNEFKNLKTFKQLDAALRDYFTQQAIDSIMAFFAHRVTGGLLELKTSIYSIIDEKRGYYLNFLDLLNETLDEIGEVFNVSKREDE